MLDPQQVIGGILESLTTSVLPELKSGYARGQFYAIVELLENLGPRVQWGGLALNAEAGMLTGLAAELVSPLEEQGFGELAERARVYAGREAEGVLALEDGRALVCAIIESGAADDGPVKALVDGYLINDAVTKGMTLQPSRLAEISQG